MAYDTGEKYLKEIDHVSILESIDEVFDGATSLLTENAVMYGSSVTSIISGLPIVGDLDVSVSKEEYMRLCQNFANSVKWLQIQGNTIPENQGPGRYKPTLKLSSGGSNPYKNEKHLPIDQVVAFHTVNNARVQIMQSKTMTGDPLEDALDVVRKVDFAFCGMAVDRWGRMLETIPNAYSDCLARVIRVHKWQPRLDPNRFKLRVRKYVKRGWSMTFSMDQAMLNLKRARALEAKAPKKRKKHGPKKISGFRIKKSAKKGIVIETTIQFMNTIGGGSNTRDIVRHFATDQRSIRINSTTNKMGKMEFWEAKGSKYHLTVTEARKIIRDADDYFRSKYRAAYEKMRQEKKNQDHKLMYNNPSGTPKGYYYTGTISASSTSTTSNW
jgi:hypothetical protein